MKEESGRLSFQILVIEDQTRHQKIFKETFLAELNANVEFATTGEEGLARIAAGLRPDLVVLDLDLPGISGREVLKRLKNDIRTRIIPVIILTGSSSQIVEMDLLENGAEDYLEKGSHPEILVSRIRAQVRHKKAIDRLQQLAIDRDIFAAGVLANINTTHKILGEQSEQVKALLASDPERHGNEVRALMDSMCEHASRLGQFASDVIQSVRDSQRFANPQPVSLDEFINIVNSVPAPSKEGKAGISFSSQGPLGAIYADPDYFRIVMLNLIQNISERAHSTVDTNAATEAPRKVKASLTARDAKLPGYESAVELIIRDFGRPIPEREIASLFEPRMASVDGNATPTFDIGLAVVSNAVKKIGGQIWVEQPKDGNEGSEFHLILPRD